jgi:hypothetical protein
MKRIGIVTALFLPMAVMAQSGPEDNPGMQSLSVDQLCEERSSDDSWAEIEDRDVFSRRELRAIKKERMRSGISPDAVSCFMGQPLGTVYLLASGQQQDEESPPEFAMFVYPTDEADSLVVFVRSDTDYPTVLTWRWTEDWQSYAEMRPIDCSRRTSGNRRPATSRSMQRYWCSNLLGERAIF